MESTDSLIQHFHCHKSFSCKCQERKAKYLAISSGFIAQHSTDSLITMCEFCLRFWKLIEQLVIMMDVSNKSYKSLRKDLITGYKH